MGLRREKGYAGVAQEELKTTDPTTWQREHPHINKPETLKIIKEKKEKNWSLVPDECLTPRQTGRLTVGRNITLT
jgi:hypothetical protein